MFKITYGKGFHLTFPNGVTLSTQFGGGNYCENFNFEIGAERKKNMQSRDAEIAIWNAKAEWITGRMQKDLFSTEDADSVMGHIDMETWLKIVDWCRIQEA